MTQHTPGPWEGRHCPNMPAEPLNYGVIHNGKEVARVWKREDVDIIAAAPDLLAALKHAVIMIKACQKQRGADDEEMHRALKPYQTAIARAERKTDA